jgi:regulator of sirC expression with transglutaminase-like and TPR domain
MRFFILGLIFILWACGAQAAIEGGVQEKRSPELKTVRDILALPEERINLAEARLHFEKYLDPSIDINANLTEIERILAAIKTVPRYSETVEGKLNALIQYIYHPGKWNNHKPYRYDFDDPLGTTKPKNGLISNYLKTRRGNCVSMPILLLILGEKLGLDMSLSTVPFHLFVQLKDQGNVFNVEATAGGLKAKESYIKEFLISSEALENGLYLQSLSKKETLAVMLSGLANKYSKSDLNKDFDKALELTSLMLESYPNYPTAMIIRGNVWRNIMHRDLEMVKKKRIKRMTLPMKKHFDELLRRNNLWYSKAESIGWREPPKDYDERYLKMVREARKNYE